MRKKLFFFAVLAATLLLSSSSPKTYRNPFADKMQWWTEARFGMFIHWGISSLEGMEISWPRNKYGPERYDSLALRFNPYKFDADKWMEVAANAGMKYIVLTTKHHDGFCLWDTKTTDHSIMNTPYGKDICAQIADAARRHGLRIGWYFTAQDWHDKDCATPDRNDLFIERMKAQLHELLTNYGKIDLVWFDFEGHPSPAKPKEIFDYVRSVSPDIVINNRLYPVTADESHAYVGSYGMYATPEQFVGGYGTVPWETCTTASRSRQWSIRYNDPPRPMKDLVWETIGAAGGNGNMLMNIGPDSLGVIPAEYAQRFAEIGDWIKAHDGILYGTTCGPWKPCGEYASTAKGKQAYLLLKTGKDITLPFSNAIRITSATVEGSPVRFTINGDRITFDIPEEYQGQANVAIRLQLAKALGKNFTPISYISTSGSLAYDKPSWASSSLNDYYMHCPSSAFDDNERTFWHSGRSSNFVDDEIYGSSRHYNTKETATLFDDDAVLEVDLQGKKAVTSFQVIPSGNTKGTFSIEYKKGGKWIQAATTQDIQKEWKGEIEECSARHWRLVVNDAFCGNRGWGIREFRLFSQQEK